MFSLYLFFKITGGWFLFKVLHANNTELNILQGQEKAVSDFSHKILKESSHSGSVLFPSGEDTLVLW